ncbi:hypothetical protein [Microbacterium sp. LWH13-1.2]|uniref:hypothetical protein n=1 Tax=Microbacterium sp. LWH13-1.2 TaxID=3135260 RepID=UPI0031393B37
MSYHRIPGSLRAPLVRGAAGATIVLVALAATGCSFGASEHDEDSALVMEFFDRLIEGDAVGAGALLSDSSIVSPAALDDDIYAEAARPVEARVTVVTGSPSDASVSVEYRLDGESEPREIDVRTTTAEGELRIAQWGDLGVYFDGQGVPGVLESAGVTAFDLTTTDSLRLLPGIYDFEYTDEQELTTIDPGGGDGEPFALEFPAEASTIEPPAGAEMVSKIMVLHPVLRTEVADDAQAEVDRLLSACTASGLTGSDCPSVIADGTARRAWEGAVDVSSVVWRQNEPLALVRGDGVRAGAPFTVNFSWPSGPQEVTVDVAAAVQRDASGAVAVDFD